MPSPTHGIMIDRAGTPDRDDAIWVCRNGAGWDAGVHIADVARMVLAGSEVDVRAAGRLWTTYLPDRTLPMLPAKLGAAVSLTPNRPRSTFRIRFHIGADGEVGDIRLDRGQLTHGTALDYAQAATAVAEPAHPNHDTLRAAYEAARVLYSRRLEHGALVIYDLIRGWVSDGDSGLRRLDNAERHPSYLIVSELMIAANEAMAGYCVRADVPILFRNHRAALTAPPREQLIADLRLLAGEGTEHQLGLVRERLQHLLQPATYDPHVEGHFGLHLSWYCHATSPLRRYADLVVQRQLGAALRGDTPPYTPDDLTPIAQGINARWAQARERRAARHKEAAKNVDRTRLASAAYRDLDEDAFSKILKVAIREEGFSTTLEQEVLHRLANDQIAVRDAYHLLLTASAEPWATCRTAIVSWIARHPEHAVTVLSMHVQNAGLDAPRWNENATGSAHQPQFTAQAGISSGSGGMEWSAWRSARTKAGARQQAARSLVALLANLPDSHDQGGAGDETGCASFAAAAPAEPAQPVRRPGHNPIMTVHEWGQVGIVSDLAWSHESSGPPHSPSFVCRASAVYQATGTPVEVTGTGRSKGDAKTTAAEALCQRVLSMAGADDSGR